MIIFSPVKPLQVGQKFGDHLACINNETGAISYKKGATCPLGLQDFYDSMGLLGHNGNDFKAYIGQPLYFPVWIDGMKWKAEDAPTATGTLLTPSSPLLAAAGPVTNSFPVLIS